MEFLVKACKKFSPGLKIMQLFSMLKHIFSQSFFVRTFPFFSLLYAKFLAKGIWFSCEPSFCAHAYDVCCVKDNLFLCSYFLLISWSGLLCIGRQCSTVAFNVAENCSKSVYVCRLEWFLGVCFRGNFLNVERTVSLYLHKVSKRKLKYRIGAGKKITQWQRLEKNWERKKGVGKNMFCFLVPKKVNPDEIA